MNFYIEIKVIIELYMISGENTAMRGIFQKKIMIEKKTLLLLEIPLNLMIGCLHQLKYLMPIVNLIEYNRAPIRQVFI